MLSAEMIQLVTLYDLAQDTHEAAMLNAGVVIDANIHVHNSRQDTRSLLHAAALMGWKVDESDGIVWAVSDTLDKPRVVVFWNGMDEITGGLLWADLMAERQSERGREIQAYIVNLSPAEILEKYRTDPRHSLVRDPDFVPVDPDLVR